LEQELSLATPTAQVAQTHGQMQSAGYKFSQTTLLYAIIRLHSIIWTFKKCQQPPVVSPNLIRGISTCV